MFWHKDYRILSKDGVSPVREKQMVTEGCIAVVGITAILMKLDR
ncbi:MAG: hypothetical protein ACLUI7_08730 [Coprococcus sp.]